MINNNLEGVTFYIDFTLPKQPHWCVYSLHDREGKTQFIGYSALGTMMNVPDARKHPMFNEMIGNAGGAVLKIHKMFYTNIQARVYVNRWMSENGRPLMQQYFGNIKNRVPIMCVETGEEFQSITEAADKHGVSKGAISNHINGDPSHRTVHGRTYKRIDNYDPSKIRRRVMS